MATTAMVARRIGEKDETAASVAGDAGDLPRASALAAAASASRAGFSPRELLELMGAEAGVVESGSAYTAIMLGCNVVIMLLFLNNAVFRGAGDAVDGDAKRCGWPTASTWCWIPA